MISTPVLGLTDFVGLEMQMKPCFQTGLMRADLGLTSQFWKSGPAPLLQEEGNGCVTSARHPEREGLPWGEGGHSWGSAAPS